MVGGVAFVCLLAFLLYYFKFCERQDRKSFDQLDWSVVNPSDNLGASRVSTSFTADRIGANSSINRLDFYHDESRGVSLTKHNNLIRQASRGVPGRTSGGYGGHSRENTTSERSRLSSRFSSEVLPVESLNDLYLAPGSIRPPGFHAQRVRPSIEREIEEAIKSGEAVEYAATLLVKRLGHRVRMKPNTNAEVIHLIIPPIRLLITNVLTVPGIAEWGKLHPVMLPENFSFTQDDGYVFDPSADGWTLLKDFRNRKNDVFWEKVSTLEQDYSDV